jgi:intraflagellar transport protein 80
MKFSYDGNALVSGGEDGQVKLWSRNGMLRSVISQSNGISVIPVIGVSFSPNGDQVIYTFGKNLVVKPLQPTQKFTSWKAHDGYILSVDWNFSNDLIVSGGEDKRYKVWDAFGRLLYTSEMCENSISSVKWSPNGDIFSVGSYNSIRICDRAGWSLALDKPESGSIFGIAWTPNGTQFACAGGNGNIVFCNIVDKRLEWKYIEATICSSQNVEVRNVKNGHVDHIGKSISI